jgi:hypothetical protein
VGVLTRHLVAALVLVAGCASPAGSLEASPSEVVLADGGSALRYGSGSYGVVLVPGTGEVATDWRPLAEALAVSSMVVLVVESSGDAAAAQTWLLTDGGAERVAIVASGDGALVLPGLAADGARPEDQTITVSADLDPPRVTALGVEPKLFVAAEEDATGSAAAVRMADTAPGDWNLAAYVPGSATGAAILDGGGADELIATVLARLNERR